jgi:homoserine dehydrogenase
VRNPRRVRILLIGAGTLGRRFCGLIARRQDDCVDRYGIELRLVGVADSQGAALDANGLDGVAVEAIKAGGGSVAELLTVGQMGMTGLELLSSVEGDILCEASPVNLALEGEPGISHIRRALELGLHVSTPNKGPIVLAYRELETLAQRRGKQLRFDGTVAGGLPAIALGARDLRGAVILKIESVPNLTTGFVLEQLAAGAEWPDAVQSARMAGVLEGDGAWDLDGWDTAAKLVILAQSVLNVDACLDDVPRQGISGSDGRWLRASRSEGIVRLLASAVREEMGSYRLDVRPTVLPPTHPLGRLGDRQMGIVYHTDAFGTIASIIEEPTPMPSAATMLRDLLEIYCG